MRYVVTFLLSIIGFSALYYFDVNNTFAFIILGIIIIISVMLPLLSITLWEKNADKMERFLVKNKQNPNFYIIYALANELDEDVRVTTEKLVRKSNQKSRQAMYKVIEHLYFKDFEKAKMEIDTIAAPAFRDYYQAIILIEEENFEEADNLINRVTSKWKKYALLAEREKKLNHMEEAANYAEQAKQHCKGLQRYLLEKTYQREFGI